MALYMGKVKIAGSGSGGGGSYVLPEATSSTLGGVKVGMVDTDEKLGVKLDPTTKQAYVTKAGGTGTCNYNYTQLSGTVEDIVEGNNTEIGNIVETKLTANNTAIGTVVEGKLTENNSAIGTIVENKLTANNPTIQGYVTGNNDVLSSMISSIVEKIVIEKEDENCINTLISLKNDNEYTLTANAYIICQFDKNCYYGTGFTMNGTYFGFTPFGVFNGGISGTLKSDHFSGEFGRDVSGYGNQDMGTASIQYGPFKRGLSIKPLYETQFYESYKRISIAYLN